MSVSKSASFGSQIGVAVGRTLAYLYGCLLFYAYGLTIVFSVLIGGSEPSPPGGPREIVVPLAIIFALCSPALATFMLVSRQRLLKFERVLFYVMIGMSVAYFPVGMLLL